jgi:site-specific recombinase XerD
MRVVGLDSQSRKNLDLWMIKRKELRINGVGNPPIFCGISKQNSGLPIQTVYVRNLLKRLAAKAGVEKRVTPHQLRHLFSHEMLTEGIGLHNIQRSLGHSAIATTSKYLERFSPLETIQRVQQREWYYWSYNPIGKSSPKPYVVNWAIK